MTDEHARPAGCAGAVTPGDAADVVPVDAIDAAAPVACINSSTCPPSLACLQGFCSTPCLTYDVCEQ